MSDQGSKFELAQPAGREGQKISQAEYRERLERLKSMGRVIGEDFEMGVTVGDKPGWRYIFKPVNKIEVDPVDVEKKDLDYCFGVIAHEGAHRKISRTDFIPKRIWQEMGFSYLMNAVEDPRVNNWVSGKYDGARQWLERVYTQDLPVEERIDGKTKEKLGYVPKHIQYGLEVIRYWHRGDFSSTLPPEVEAALKETVAYAKLAYESLPEKDPTEEDVKDKAQTMYKIVYSAIWPVYQKLVDRAFEEEKLRQMIKEMAERGEIELPPEAMAGGEGQEEGEEEKKPEQGEAGEKKEKEEKEKEPGEGGKEEKEEKGVGTKGEPMPLDELPKDLREQLKKKLRKN